MWNYMDHYGGMGFGMLLFWGVIIVALIVLFRGSCGNRKTEKSALDILKERYARGEMGRDEFEQIKRDLESREGRQ